MPEHRREASTERPPSPSPSPSDVSMRDLLASCAAAHAVSTPPREIPAVAEAGARTPAAERATRRDAA
jgi:hypothetical protein